MERTPPSAPPPVAALERHLKWRVATIAMFIGILAGLLALGVVAALTPIHSVTGLPGDPAVAAARAALAGTVSVPTGDLRFESALFDAPPAGRVDVVTARAALARADSLLEAARLRDLADARLPALLGHLALARRRYPDAERYYRAAIDLAAHTSEARLGLGVALALRAEATADPREARALTLRAIAQCAAVRRDAPVWRAALYDRALLLARVDRAREARAWAERYFAEDSTSVWSARLREALGRQ